MRKFSLQKRVIFLVTLGMLVIFAAFGVAGVLAVRDSTRHAAEERLVLAQLMAQHADYVLQANLWYLQEIAFAEQLQLGEADPQAWQKALRQVYFHSIFREGTYITDQRGRLLWMEPPRPAAVGTDLSPYPHVKEALDSGKPIVSNVYILGTSGKPVISASLPLKNPAGQIVGLVGGHIDPTHPTFSQEILRPAGLGKASYVQILDRNGVVVAGTIADHVLGQADQGGRLVALIKQKRASVGTCHDCRQGAGPPQPGGEIIAFAPTAMAEWGVVVREAEDEALAPARRLQSQFLLFGVPIFLMGLFLAWAAVQSIVKPAALLTAAAEKIAAGDLSAPVPPLGEDEIGRLGRTLDTMRQKLKASLESIQQLNRELEARVQQRTGELAACLVQQEGLYTELERKEATRGELLRKVISAQEEERRRIARELHDDTSQALAALALALERAALAPPGGRAELKAQLAAAKSLALETLEGVHRLIFDLRPSLLDDLGLLAALRWYAESRLQPLGVRVHMETAGRERRLAAQVETALFRAVQEAITNIARHAQAENAALSLDYRPDRIVIEVEDDGKGFDVDALASSADDRRGLGLASIRERISLLDGTLSIQSELGRGTKIHIEVPLAEGG